MWMSFFRTRPDQMAEHRDMAPDISGISDADHLRSMELIKAAIKFSRNHLRVGGHFLAKIFEGRLCSGTPFLIGSVISLTWRRL